MLTRLNHPSLKDLVVRTETNKLVTDLVNLDRVRSLLKMISHRRRFLAQRKQLHMTWMQHQGNLPLTRIMRLSLSNIF